MDTRRISFGFLLVPLQALDMVGPMDLLFNLSHELLGAYYPALIDALHPPDITFHYIGPTLDPVRSANGLFLKPTATLDTCPRLDYLLIGGPMPSYAMNLPSEIKKFIIDRSKEVKIIFTTCSGGLVLGATGLLDGLEATTNHVALPDLGRQISPRTKWNKEKSWVISNGPDCTFWTGAGAIAGMDMISQWVREEFTNGQQLLDLSTAGLDYQPRDADAKPMTFTNGRMKVVQGAGT